MKRLINAIKNAKGMTLTEVMVGVAIIALVSTMMASGFLAASALIRRGVQVGGASGVAVMYIEMQKAGDGEVDVTENTAKKNLTIRGADGNPVTIAGSYYTYAPKAGEGEASVEYRVFVPADGQG